MTSFRLAPDASITFLHTSPVHVATFDHLLHERFPHMRATHLVDASLLDEVRRHGPTAALQERLNATLDELANAAPDLIVCTCSSIGPLAEGFRGTIRLDRPMAESAVRIAAAKSGRIGIAAAVESTVEPTTALVKDVASRMGVDIVLTIIPCFAAWQAFEIDDQAAYAAGIAAAVSPVATPCDVIVLAQASMAVAVPLLADLPIPILTSPAALLASFSVAAIGHS